MPRKKSRPRAEVAALCEAWAAAWTHNAGYLAVAKEIRDRAGTLTPNQLTEFLIGAVFASWKARYATGTLWVRRSALKSLLRFIAKAGGPELAVPKMRKPQPRAVTADMNQLQNMLATAKPHMRLLILLCWQLALRFGEARSITPANWNAEKKTVTVRAKGGKIRCIPTTPDVDEMLRVAAHGEPHTPCIEILHGGPLSYKGLANAYRRLRDAALATNVKPHDLRRTTANALYAITKDIRAVQQYLGHDHMTSTLHYLPPLKDEKLREYQKLLNFHSEVKQ